MSGKYTWKIAVTVIVLGWAILNLIPIKDTPFEEYLRQEAVSDPRFEALLAKAKERTRSAGESIYLPLRRVAEEENADLSQYFPQVNLEKSLGNIRKRNAILLDELLKRSKRRLQLGLDLKGGVAFVLEVDRPAGVDASEEQRQEELSKAIEIIGERVDAFGVTEPIIRPIGGNRIEVQIAGLSTRDNPEIVNELKKPARLEFRLVHRTLRPESMNRADAPPGFVPMDLEHENGQQVSIEPLYVKRLPELTGEAVETAYPAMDDYGRFRILLKFTGEGAERFADVTKRMAQENQQTGSLGRLAIVLDGKLYSAPTVREEIGGGNAEISGSFTQREAFELSNVLNNPLDVPLRVVSMSEVGPSLAEDSISSGWKAFTIGASLTAVFILIYYTTGGFMAVLAMVCNVLIILGVMASFGATLSMPGIAGIVLTLGMSVDSNILIFERMREELATGKNLRAGLEAGFEKAFSAIFDANLTTLITAVIMILLGTGPVKGFGVTLTIGIFSTMFAALIVSRLLLELIVLTGAVKRIPMLQAVPETKFDFMKYARPAFISSWTIVLIGVAVVVAKGRDIYGIDFLGGDEVTLEFKQKVDVSAIRTAAAEAGVREITPSYQQLIGSDREVLKMQMPFDDGAAVVSRLQQQFPEAGFDVVAENRIGAAVSSQIQWNALWAIVLSLVGILIYVAFRFEVGYGVGAVVSTVHDLVMTIGIFVVLGRQFNAAMVGAILLIAGYSINDTIVVFDRIREELTLNPNMRLRDVINLSLNRTLARTIVTGMTTLATAITLFLVAGGAVNDIALTLIIGIITGTFSSVFIASPIFYWWHKGDRKHVEASHDIAPKYEWSASSRASE